MNVKKDMRVSERYIVMFVSFHRNKVSEFAPEESRTRDVDAVVFDVHLMQTSLSWSVLDGNSAVLVVCDVRLRHGA